MSNLFSNETDHIGNYSSTQDNDSSSRKRRLNRPETAIRRSFSALNFTVSYRHPGLRAVFFPRNRPSFFSVSSIHFWDDGDVLRRFSPFFYRLRPFTTSSSSTWVVIIHLNDQQDHVAKNSNGNLFLACC